MVFVIGRQPPCEAVSWNSKRECRGERSGVSLLVRLWVEIWLNCKRNLKHIVSLLVRLWVEMPDTGPLVPEESCQPPCEAVSWNVSQQKCGYSHYRQPPCEAVSWNVVHDRCAYKPSHVSLLVRLWVEILVGVSAWSGGDMSASLWGCELKYVGH